MISEEMLALEKRLYRDPFKGNATKRNEPVFNRSDVNYYVAKEIISTEDSVVRRGAKNMSNTFQEAEAILKQAEQSFNIQLTAFNAATDKLQDSVKKTSSGVRKAAHEIGDGVQKVMKNINLDQLERTVHMLERAATAMSTLAELQKDGRLDQLLDAMKK